MDAEEAARRFVELFHRVFVTHHRRARSGERRLTREAIAVLLHLTRTGPLTIVEACRHFSRSQAAMSDLVTRMERRGLLARMPDERDRRRTLVWLTEEGRQRLEEETTVLDPESVTTALRARTAAQREELLRSLAGLLGESLESLDDPSLGDPPPHDEPTDDPDEETSP